MFNKFDMPQIQEVKLIYAIIVAIIALIVAFGFFMFLLFLFNMNSGQKTKNLSKLRNSGNNNSGSLADFLTKIAKKNTHHKIIKKSINPYDREKLLNEFEILGINKTPEEHLVFSILSGVIFVLFGLVLGVMCLILVLAGLKEMAGIGIGLFIFFTIMGVITFFLEYGSIEDKINKRKNNIVKELPKFVSFLENSLKNDKDVIKMISNYTEDGYSPLVEELKILLVDIKTGDYEFAFNRFASRTNKVEVSDISRGLIATMRGDDTQNYFEMLSNRLWEAEKRRLTAKALKRPKRINILTFFLFFGMILIYFVVFGTVILEGLQDVNLGM